MRDENKTEAAHCHTGYMEAGGARERIPLVVPSKKTALILRDARVRSELGFGPGSDRTGPWVRSGPGSGSALDLGVWFKVRGGLGML